MATNTDNFGLIKPDQEDFYDVEDFNANMDTIDAVMAELGTDSELAENVREIKTNTEDIKLDIADVKKDVGEVDKGVTAVGVNIGGTADTGGTATKGTLMAKLNANIKRWGDMDGDILEDKLNELLGLGPRYVPSDTAQVSLYKTPLSVNKGSQIYVLFNMVAEYDGKIRVKFEANDFADSHLVALSRSDIPLQGKWNRTRSDKIGNLPVDTTGIAYAPTGTILAQSLISAQGLAVYHAPGSQYMASVIDFDLLVPMKKGESFSVFACLQGTPVASATVSNFKVLYDIEEVTA